MGAGATVDFGTDGDVTCDGVAAWVVAGTWAAGAAGVSVGSGAGAVNAGDADGVTVVSRSAGGR